MGCTSGFQEITEESLTADALVLTICWKRDLCNENATNWWCKYFRMIIFNRKQILSISIFYEVQKMLGDFIKFSM